MLWHVVKLEAELSGMAPRYVRVATLRGTPGELEAAWPGAAGVLSLHAVDPAGEGANAPGGRTPQAAQGAPLRAPMAGRVQAVHVILGARVEQGAPLVVLEAMKMEHVVTAPHPGVVRAVHVQAGAQVNHRAPLVELGASDAE